MWTKTEQRILRVLNIKSSEKVMALWSFMLAFLIGSAQCYLSAVPMSLFLTRFSSASLPQVYLVVAGLAIALGSVYTFFENRLPFNRLMLGFILVIGCITTSLWFLLAGLTSIWIVALLTVWAIVAYDLLDLGLWSVFNRIYNLQQGKRLFGIIGASQSIGGIFSGLMLPLLLFFVATEHVILLISLIIFAALVILAGLLRTQINPEEDEDDEDVANEKNSLSKIFKNKYIFKLMCLVTLGVFAMYIVDILFNTVAEQRYPNEEALAGFLGVFFGLVDGMDLLLSTFLFSWLLSRYGIIFSLMILPVLGILTGVFLLISHAVPLLVILIFWLVVVLKLFEEAIRASISDMSNLLLLQPLSPSLRAFALSKSDTFFVPLATAVISILLILVTHSVGIVIPWFVTAVLVCYGLYVLITLTLKTDYITVLTKAIANRYTLASTAQHINKESVPLFQKALLSKYPDEVIYALTTIENIDKPVFFNELKSTLKSKEIEVRRFTLKKIREYRLTDFYSQVLSSLEKEPNKRLQALIIRTLAALNYDEASHKISSSINDDSQIVSRTAIVTTWSYGDTLTQESMFEKVNQMISSEQETLRRSAAIIIGEVNNTQANNLLGILAHDENLTVKIPVLKAILKTKHHTLLNKVISNLDTLPLSGSTLEHFLSLGECFMPIIQEHFSNYSHAVQLKILYTIGEMNLRVGVLFLENSVLTQKGILQQAALRALSRTSDSKSNIFLDKLYRQIKEEVNHLSELQQFLNVIPMQEATGLLRDVFRRKVTLSIERLLLSIAIFYQDSPMMKIKSSLESGNEDEISYALELLERILDPELKRVISPVLIPIFLTEETHNENSNDFHELIKAHLHANDKEPMTILTCIACLYVIKEIGREPFSAELATLNNSTYPIIQETLIWLGS